MWNKKKERHKLNAKKKIYIYPLHYIDQNILYKMKLLYKIFIKKKTPKNNKNSY